MYSAQITRLHKAAFVILLDQSGSMAEELFFQGRTTSKAEALAESVNTLIEEIIHRSRRERYVSNYFDIAIIGYGEGGINSPLGGGYKSIVDIDAMDVNSYTKITRHTLPSGKQIETFAQIRQWITPQANGQTPMGEALAKAQRLVASWCRKHPDSFPPIVINITDGEATDASDEKIRRLAERITSTATNDGNTLLMNIHLASQYDTPTESLRFPTETTTLPINRHSQLLYDTASTLPSLYNATLRELRGEEPPFRAVCYNATLDDLVGLLAIGSLSINQMI